MFFESCNELRMRILSSRDARVMLGVASNRKTRNDSASAASLLRAGQKLLRCRARTAAGISLNASPSETEGRSGQVTAVRLISSFATPLHVAALVFDLTSPLQNAESQA